MGLEVDDLIQELKVNLDEVGQILKEDPQNADALEMKGQLEGDLADALEMQKSVGDPDASQKADVEQPPDAAQASASTVGQKRRREGHAHNQRIHPRSKYAYEQPDFQMLADKYPSFAKFVKKKKGKPALNFANPQAALELTRVLLKEDFGLEWSMPVGMLVPPLTGRLNYLLWLEDLLGLSTPPGDVRGLDIGCGANCVYPLLGATALEWEFVGVDIEEAAVESAKKNVEMNPSISHLISIRHVAKGCKDILKPALEANERFHFSMCNPPFFATMEESGQNPNTAFGGTPTEMVYPGGELAFLSQMIEDSVELQGAVHWYSTLLGKKTTLKEVRNKLYSVGAKAIRTTELFQGKTSRWAVAWSFVAKGTENKPLRRQAVEGVQAAPITIRTMCCEVKSGKKSALDLLHMMEKIFGVHNGTCDLNASTSAMKITVPVEGIPLQSRAKKLKGKGTQQAAAPVMCTKQLEVSVRVSQEKSGFFTATASIARESSNADARGFSKLLNAVFEDLRMMWG
ncbi:hypothetical protein BSKO_00306 [Bryopsis sp. KO-2023]|nr:hypothetical protein BSKO_00306 [Bryopsis sp. KO-2023]